MLLFLILASASLVCAIVPFVISNFIVDFFLALLALLLAIIAFSTSSDSSAFTRKAVAEGISCPPWSCPWSGPW